MPPAETTQQLSYFHNWIDYYGVAFSLVTRSGAQIFGIFEVRKFW